MSFSIPVVDDEPDVADLFRQRFRREARQGTYGAAEFIIKPVDFEMLKERLRQLPGASD
jgi:hypothetical protein